MMHESRLGLVGSVQNGVDWVETLQTVAEQFGVHASTVSRALREPRKSTRNAMTLAIRKYADDTGFRPNATASSLRTNKTRTIGVLVPSVVDSIHAEIYTAVDSAAVEAGYTTMLSVTSNLGATDESRANSLVHSRVDGIVVQDSHYGDPLPAHLRRLGIPFVMTIRRAGDNTFVAVDDRRGGHLAALHLLENQPKTQLVVSASNAFPTFNDRVKGFIDTWKERREDDVEVMHSGLTAEDGRRTARNLLDSGTAPDSIFVCSDQTAAGFVVEMWRHGLKAGNDYALVGFNDIELASLLPVPLTTVQSPLAEIGRMSTEVLLSLIDGNSPASVLVTPTLNVRSSGTLTK